MSELFLEAGLLWRVCISDAVHCLVITGLISLHQAAPLTTLHSGTWSQKVFVLAVDTSLLSGVSVLVYFALIECNRPRVQFLQVLHLLKHTSTGFIAK